MRALTWCRLLNKRFLKRPAFLALLVLVPLLTAALALTARGERGMLTVALYAPDKFSARVAEVLLSEESVLRYVAAESEAEARALVADGDADAAWLFSPDAEKNIARYAAGGKISPAVTVVEREDNVFLRLAREKLYAALFPNISRAAWEAFLERESGGALPAAEALDAYYAWRETGEPLVRFAYMDGGDAEAGDYLLSPVRGLLAVLLVLGGLAGASVYERDRRAGTLARVSGGAAFPLAAAYALLPVLDLALVIYLALHCAGLSAGRGREALLLFLLVLAAAPLALILARLCGTEARTGVAALLLAVCMLALCPVFLNLRSLRGLSLLLPPFYYLHAVHNAAYAAYLALYAAAAWAVCFLVFRVKK